MKYDPAWDDDGLSYAILPLMFATCKLIAVAHSYADGAGVDAKVRSLSLRHAVPRCAALLARSSAGRMPNFHPPLSDTHRPLRRHSRPRIDRSVSKWFR